MKSTFKLLGIIAFVVIIGLAFASCGDTDDGGGNITIEKAVYTSVDDEGNKYELTITPQSDKAAYEPKAGDTYTLTIYYKDGTTKTSVGTVTHEVKNGSTVTATLSVSDISYTVTLLTITDDVRVFTEIKGTIPITGGNDDDPPTIEIELTLTPQVDNSSTAVIGVILNKTALALDVGGSETLVATVLPTNAANKAVTWSSSDNAVASVSQSGLVTAVAKGSAVITVTTEDGNKEAICNVSVKEVIIGEVPVTGVSLNKTSTILAVGGTETLYETITPINATNKTVTWSSSAPAVAQVSQSGLVSALAAGSATITVTTVNGIKATCSVTVSAVNVPVTGISLSKNTLILDIGGTELLAAIIEPFNATNRNVTWSSSAPTIATVSSSGLVTGVATGSTNITVTTADGGFTTTCAVTVNVPVSVTGVTLNKTSTSIMVGGTETLTATVAPSNATNKAVTWNSSTPTIATVTNGLITGIAAGTANITVTTEDGNKTATCGVLVSASAVVPTGVRLNKTILELGVGDTETLTATVLPSNATNQNVTWEIINPPDKTIATISESGVVHAVSVGDSQIFASTSNGLKAACAVKVREVPVTGVTLNKTALAIKVGESETLIATVLPANATNKAVKWSSSNTDIATVSSNGLVSGVSVGSAVITVTTVDGGFTATCTVTVTSSTTTVPVTGVTLNKTTLALDVGASETLIATVLPANATNKTVSWISDIPSIVTVINGLVTAKASGSADITVTTQDGGFTTKCAITVRNEDEQPFTSIAAFEKWLSKQTDNTPTSAYEVKLNVNDLTGIDLVLTGAPKKYVNLDISDSTVTSIENYAFRYCKSITSITIPNSVTSIGIEAFSGCQNLASVTIPNSVTSIGGSAFGTCISLTSVIIGNGVTSIGSFTFSDCHSLASITFPDSVTNIGDYVFSSCTNLTAINVGLGNNVYSSDNGVLYNKNKTSLIRYPAVKTAIFFTIPNSVTRIENGAFGECINLTSITIPNSVTSIGKSAFIGCIKLASITIPNGVTSIEDSVFYRCSKLASVTIPDSVTSIRNYAFSQCTSLTSITIPDSVTSIGIEAFCYTNIVSVTIPDGVTSIELGTFLGCSSLASVTLPVTITSFSTTAFMGDLYTKYHATNGGQGNYTTTAPVSNSSVWTKQ